MRFAPSPPMSRAVPTVGPRATPALAVAFLLGLCPALPADLSANPATAEATTSDTTGDAAGWTRFRGPNGSGHGAASGLPATIDDRAIAWRATLPGAGHSSPVLWRDTLFLTAEDSEQPGHRQVLAIATTDGAVRWSWQAPFDPHRRHDSFNNFASTTPTVDAKRVYVSWNSGDRSEVIALDHDGEPLWHRVWPGFVPDHGTTASPILVDGVLIVSHEHKGEGAMLAGLNPVDGDTLWQEARTHDKDAYGTPVVAVDHDGSRQLITVSTAYGFEGRDPRTGRLLWRHNPGFQMRAVGSPTAAGDIVVATLGQGAAGRESAVLRIGSSDGGRPPELLHELGSGMPYVPTPLVVDGRLYLLNDGGLFSCVDLMTGEVLYDRERLPAERNAKWFSSPVLADGKIWCASLEGEVVTLQPGAGFQVLGTSSLGAPVNATPAVDANTIYLRAGNELLAVRGSAR